MLDPIRGSVRLARRAAGLWARSLRLTGSDRRDERPDLVWTAERAPTATGGGARRARGATAEGAVAPVRRTHFELAGGPNAPGAARAVVRGALDEALDPAQLDDALVLISELVMNSVLHAGADARHPVVIHLAVAPELVRVEVCDEGSGFDPTALRARRAKRGFGLLFLERMARAWGVTADQGMACVWFELDRVTSARSRAR